MGTKQNAEEMASLGLEILKLHDQTLCGRPQRTFWRDGEEWHLRDICFGAIDDYKGTIGETETWDWVRRVAQGGAGFIPPKHLCSSVTPEQRESYLKSYAPVAELVRKLRVKAESVFGGWFTGRPGMAEFLPESQIVEARKAFYESQNGRRRLLLPSYFDRAMHELYDGAESAKVKAPDGRLLIVTIDDAAEVIVKDEAGNVVPHDTLKERPRPRRRGEES